MTANIYQVAITYQALLQEPDTYNFIESLWQLCRCEAIISLILQMKRKPIKNTAIWFWDLRELRYLLGTNMGLEAEMGWS